MAWAFVAFAASMAAADKKHVLDHVFIDDHTAGFEEFAQACRRHDWSALEHVSGLSQAQMRQAAEIYANAKAVLIIYGMGLTQQVMGVEISKVSIPVAAGRNLAVLTEAAVRNYVLQQRGVDSTREFIMRQSAQLQRRDE